MCHLDLGSLKASTRYLMTLVEPKMERRPWRIAVAKRALTPGGGWMREMPRSYTPSQYRTVLGCMYSGASEPRETRKGAVRMGGGSSFGDCRLFCDCVCCSICQQHETPRPRDFESRSFADGNIPCSRCVSQGGAGHTPPCCSGPRVSAARAHELLLPIRQ